MLITLQKTLTDLLPLVSMNFENELSETLKQGFLFYETNLETVPSLTKFMEFMESPNPYLLS